MWRVPRAHRKFAGPKRNVFDAKRIKSQPRTGTAAQNTGTGTQPTASVCYAQSFVTCIDRVQPRKTPLVAWCPPSPPSLACLGLGLTGPLRSRSYQHPLARARPRAAPNTMIMWAALTSLLLLTGANAAAPAAGAVAFGAAPGDRSMLHGHGTIPCTLECSINHALSSPPCPMISARHALCLRLAAVHA